MPQQTLRGGATQPRGRVIVGVSRGPVEQDVAVMLTTVCGSGAKVERRVSSHKKTGNRTHLQKIDAKTAGGSARAGRAQKGAGQGSQLARVRDGVQRRRQCQRSIRG
jgi:hypothetical protein